MWNPLKYSKIQKFIRYKFVSSNFNLSRFTCRKKLIYFLLSLNTNIWEIFFLVLEFSACWKFVISDVLSISARYKNENICISLIELIRLHSFGKWSHQVQKGEEPLSREREREREREKERRIFLKVYLSLRDIQNKHFFSCNYHNSPSNITQEFHVMILFRNFSHLFSFFPFFPPLYSFDRFFHGTDTASYTISVSVTIRSLFFRFLL